MKILVWGINYAPEVTGIGRCNTALCEELQIAGHDVEMVTTFPYYPEWKKRQEDRGTVWRSEVCHGVSVHRCWHYVPARPNWWRRMVHEATFILTSLPRVLSLRRPDLIIAVSPPLLLGAASRLVSKLLRTCYILHVQDLQPDAALASGLLRRTLFTRFLYALEAFAYQGAWRVSGISKGMLAALSSKGVPVEKQVYFPNGIGLESWPSRGLFRRRHRIPSDAFLVVYSGNIGVKQGLEAVVSAAGLIRESRIRIIICGDGAQRHQISAQAAKVPNVLMLPLLPTGEYREMLVDTDLAIVPQMPGTGGAFFPSKLLDPLSCSRPVIAIGDADSELSKAIHDGAFGCHVSAEPAANVARTLETLAANPAQLASWGRNGRSWVQQFEQARVVADFLQQLQPADPTSANPPG